MLNLTKILNKKRILNKKWTICNCRGGSAGAGHFQTICLQISAADK